MKAFKVTQHDSEILNGKGKSERLHEAQGREATACANTAGKIVNVTVEPVTLEKNPANEFLVIKLH